MKKQLVQALKSKYSADFKMHKANLDIYLNNPVGIGEHSNIVEAIEQELNEIAKYQDQIDVIQKYFMKKSDKSNG